MLPLLILSGLSSCIRDGLMECPPILDYNVKVVVRMPGGNVKSYYDFKVQSIDMYVFHESDGAYVDGYKRTYNAAAETEFFFDLPPGNYRFVAWANPGFPYKVNYTREECIQQGITYKQMINYFESGTDKTVRDDMPDLLFGHLTHAEVEITKNEFFVVQAIPYTNIINLTAEGLPANTNGYTLSVIDDNSHYTFDNNYIPAGLIPERTLKYERILKTNSPYKQTASIKVLRLTDPDFYPDKINPVISLTDNATSAIIYEKDLIQIIKTSYLNNSQILDFDKETVFDITLQFDVNLDVTISVNGWNMSDQPEELE